MKTWIIRVAVAIPILLVLAVAAAALSNVGLPTESQVIDRLSEAEKARLAEAFHLRRALGGEVWPGWDEAHGLSNELIDYERQMEWLEGLAKYAELAIQREAALAAGYLPVPAIGDDPDFHGYRDGEQYWGRQVDEIRRLSGRSGDGRFYYTGFGQAVLLDRFVPGWKDQAWDQGVWLEDLLVEALVVRRAV